MAGTAGLQRAQGERPAGVLWLPRPRCPLRACGPAGRPQDIKINVVDTESRELVYALIVSAEAQGPLVSR